jgi:hypothetical protein
MVVEKRIVYGGYYQMDKKEIAEIANTILEQKPDPVIEHLLKTKILNQRLPNNCVQSSGWYEKLKGEQRADGSWGRYHSANRLSTEEAALIGMFPTTEAAVFRCCSMGLDKNDPIVQKAIVYLERVLKRETMIPDHPVRLQQWEQGIDLIGAAVLSLMDSENHVFDSIYDNYLKVFQTIFASGSYDAKKDAEAQLNILGLKEGFGLNNKFTLYLLSSRSNRIPKSLECNVLDWIWYYKPGVYYYKSFQLCSYEKATDAIIGAAMLPSMEILTKFRFWRPVCKGFIEYLISRRGIDGYWDFGKKPNIMNEIPFPLSESWRGKNNRKFDYTTKVLLLLNAYYR